MKERNLDLNFILVVDLSSDIVYVTDRQGLILYANPAFEKTTGYSKEEVTGTHADMLYSTSYDKEFLESIWRTLEAKLPYRGVTTNRKKNGDVYFEEKTVAPVLDSNGEIMYFTSTGHDITNRLEHEMIEARLAKELKKSNEDLEAFNRTVAHDLRNPLNGIDYVANKIYKNYRQHFTDKDTRLYSSMLREIRSMNVLITDLLEYAGAGLEQAFREDIDMNDLVNEVIHIHRLQSPIHFAILNELPLVHFSGLQLKQIFGNLVGNAVKYMDKPNGKVEVGCEKMGTSIRYYVRDNGPGIDRMHFDKLFKPFQKAHTRTDIQSNGLGLSIVKKIVEIAGGSIDVVSETGKGSLFSFTLPGAERMKPQRHYLTEVVMS
jgi:two-component system sensor kinase FixL